MNRSYNLKLDLACVWFGWNVTEWKGLHSFVWLSGMSIPMPDEIVISKSFGGIDILLYY